MTRRVVRLSESLRQAMIDHCLRGLPNEGCGLLAMTGDEIVAVYPTGNEDPSPTSYRVPPAEHYAALVSAENAGWRLGGVFHSHPGGKAWPSDTDIADALDPGWLHVVIGLGKETSIGGWQITGGVAHEVALS